MPPSELPGPRRKHTTTACAPCRDSKVKCDGDFPVCATCRTRGKQCQYQASEDKRRLSHRLVVGLMYERIEELTQFIRNSGHEPPAMDEDKRALLLKALGHLRLLDAVPNKAILENPGQAVDSSRDKVSESGIASANDLTSDIFDFQQGLNMDKGLHPDQNFIETSIPRSLAVQAQTSAMNGVNGIGDADDPDWGMQPSPENRVNSPQGSILPNFEWPNVDMPLLPIDAAGFSCMQTEELGLNEPGDHPFTGPALSDSSRRQANSSSDTQRTETLVKQLAGRIGSLHIGSGGQVRYDGPTSNFNLIDMGAQDNLTVHRTVRHDGPEYLNRLNMGKTVPPELEDHLTNLYFAWQDPAIHVIKRNMYDKAKNVSRSEEQDTPYFSEALQNALCSLGAAFESRHYPTFPTYPKSLADFFADRAKTLLEIELDSPCIATVQALIILSGHDIGCKRDSRGWLYSGMATRLAFHLALHLDMTDYVSSKSITQQEADLRRDVFWAAYTVDHIWSFHLGRAFRINMECVTLEPPDASKSVDPVGQWSPYVSSRPVGNQNSLPDPTVEIHRQRVLLCSIMAPLGFALYGNLNMAPSALHQLNKITVSKLLAWKERLPSVLQVSLDDMESHYLPHVLLLHMLFHQNIIYSHRPWMSRTHNGHEPHLNDGHNPEHARAMCIESAVSIGKLLQIYDHHYGLRRINVQAVGIACSAALLLIFAVVIGEEVQSSFVSPSDPALYLGVCFNALDEFGSAWESAKKARDFLTLLRRRWDRQAFEFRESRTLGGNVIPHKRQGVPNDGDEEPRTRRHCSGSDARRYSTLDAIDFNGDLGWLLMDGESSLSSVFNPASST